MLKRTLLVFILLVLMGCNNENREWNPVFEDTGFTYFYTEIDRSLSIIDQAHSKLDAAYSKADKDNLASVQGKLKQVKNRLLEMKDYYVPLTAIRQKIYDAERFFKLKDFEKSVKLLNDSKSILKTVELTTPNNVFDKVILDLESMINDVTLSLKDNSKSAYKKMRKLGIHINLMLSKGDLVLSGIEFTK